jgi:hypothetical protein
VESHAVAVAGLHVHVQAVVGGVDLAAREPLVERRVRLVEDLVPLLEPVQVLGVAGPPLLRILVRLVVDRRVVPEGVLLELLRRLELVLLEQLLDFLVELFARGLRLRVSHVLLP